MKKLLLTAALAAIGLSGANATLLVGFDFQTAPGTAAAAAPSSPSVYASSIGTGSLYLDGTNGSSTWVTATTNNEVTSFAGSNLNTAGTTLSTTTTGTASLALLGGAGGTAANGKTAVFTLSMAGYQNLVISYATQRSGTGFTAQAWEFSTDGTTWSGLQTISSIAASFSVQTLTSTAILDNDATAFIRLTFTGASAAAGNNRLDNIQFNATAVPEPSTYALIGMGVISLMVLRRMKKSSKA